MKKCFLVLLASILILAGCSAAPSSLTSPDTAIDNSDSETLGAVIITLLLPEIQESVNGFYQPYLSVAPTVTNLAASEMIDVETDIDWALYSIAIEIEPYLGAHISVGRDRITLDILGDGTVTVRAFEHLESYDLPPHLQSLLKQPLP